MSRVKNKLTGLLVIIASLLVVGGSSVGAATAAASAKTNGITVSPARLLFSLSKDAPQASAIVTITNHYDSPVALAAEFKGIDTNAGLLIPTNDIDTAFNQALHVSATDIILAPQQVYPLTVQLQNIASLSPGGHYATLVLTQQALGNQPLALRSQISLSIFGIKTAGAIQALSLPASHTDHWLFHLPTRATLTYKNTGNVHVVPRAAVSLQRINSAEPVIQGISNASSLPLFPGKTLNDIAPLLQSQHLWLPTRLQQTIAYRYDGAANPTVVSSYIWYVPPVYGWILLAIIGGLGWRYRHKFKRPAVIVPPRLSAWTASRPQRAIKVDEASSTQTIEVATPVILQASDVPPLKKTVKPRAKQSTGKRPTTARRRRSKAK